MKALLMARLHRPGTEQQCNTAITGQQPQPHTHRNKGRPLCIFSTLDNVKLCHCTGIFFQSMRTAHTQTQIKRDIHKLVHVQREKDHITGTHKPIQSYKYSSP